MVYQLDTPGVENQAITNAKIDTGAVSTQKVDASINNALVPIKGIIMFSGTADDVPANWKICDGNNGTPNLVNKFVIAAATYDATVTPTGNDSGWRTAAEGTDEASGGEATKLLGTANLPSHTHTKGTLAVTGGDHNHQYRRLVELTDNDDNGVPVGNTGSAGPSHENANTDDSGDLTLTVSGNTGDQGGTMGEAFDILPPYYAIAYIMRVS